MKIAGRLNMLGNQLQNVTVEPVSDYPTEPVEGSFIMKDKRLMVCVSVESGLPVWVPLSQELNTFIHTENTPSTSWIINHNLNASTVLVQCFDENNNVVLPDSMDTSVEDTCTVTFSLPVAGRAVIMIGNLSGLAKPDISFDADFADSTTWTINHGLGYNPVVRIISEGFEIQPLTLFHNSTTQATATFSSAVSGKAICI